MLLATISASDHELLATNGRRLGEIASGLATKLDSDQLNSDQQSKLKRLEEVLADTTHLPARVEDAEKLRTEFAGLVASMKPGVELEASPRLLPIRWGIEAIWTVLQSGTRLKEDPADYGAVLTSLHEREPQRCPKHLHDLVEGKLIAAEVAASKKSHDDAVQRARDAKDGQSMAAALQGLLGLEGKDIDELRKGLKSRLLQTTGKQRIEVLRRTLDRSNLLETDRLRQAGIARVQDAAIGVLLDWETEEPRPEGLLKDVRALIKGCEDSLDKIAHRQQEEMAGKVREYQRWALDQISSFNQWEYDAVLPLIERDLKKFGSSTGEVEWFPMAFPSAIKEVIEKRLGVTMSDVEGANLTQQRQREIYNALGWPNWRNGINTELAYTCTREAMIALFFRSTSPSSTHLSPNSTRRPLPKAGISLRAETISSKSQKQRSGSLRNLWSERYSNGEVGLPLEGLLWIIMGKVLAGCRSR